MFTKIPATALCNKTQHTRPASQLVYGKSQLQYEADPPQKKSQKSAFHMLRYLGRNAIKCSKEFKIARIKS